MFLHKAAYVKAASKYGIDLDHDIVDELAGLPNVKVAEEINRRYAANLDTKVFGKEKTTVFVNEFIEKTEHMPFIVDKLLAHVGKVRIEVESDDSRSMMQKNITDQKRKHKNTRH